MTMTEKEALAVKLEVHKQIEDRIKGRVSALELEIQEAQRSANEETKSSVGDKYETGRAMAQLQIEKLSAQLAEFSKMKKVLHDLLPLSMDKIIQPGSLVSTSQGNFYVSVNGGEAILPEGKVTSISNASPLGKSLLGKKASDQVNINGRIFEVQAVF